MDIIGKIILRSQSRIIILGFKYQVILKEGEYDDRGDRRDRKGSNHKDVPKWRHRSYAHQMTSQDLQIVNYID